MADAGLEGEEGGGGDVLTMWHVFYSPDEHPGVFVVRAFDVVPGLLEPVPRARADLAISLDMARAMIPRGLYRQERSVDDHPSVVEIWF